MCAASWLPLVLYITSVFQSYYFSSGRIHNVISELWYKFMDWMICGSNSDRVKNSIQRPTLSPIQWVTGTFPSVKAARTWGWPPTAISAYVPTALQTAGVCSTLNGSVATCLSTATTLHRVSSISSALWRSILVVAYDKLTWNCKRMFQSGIFMCWRHTFIDKTSWQRHERSRWLCGKVGHCSFFSW